MSPRTLAAAAVALAAVGIALLLAPNHHDHQAQKSSAGSSTPSSGATAPQLGLDHDDHAHDVDREEAAFVHRFAETFAAATPHQRWLTDLSPLVTSEVHQRLELTDPRLRLSGNVTAVTPIAEVPGLYTVTYDTRTHIAVTVERSSTSQRRVKLIEPVKPQDPTGTDL